MSSIELECIEQVDDGASEEAGVVARADWLVGVAKPGDVDRDHAKASAQFGRGGEKRSLGAAQAVQSHDRWAAPGLQGRQSRAASGDHPKTHPPGTGQPARRRQESDAEMQVAPHRDRKSTRLNSSHLGTSYAVF